MALEDVFQKLEADGEKPNARVERAVNRAGGLPGRVLVHEGIQFYCTGCGQKMNEDLRDRKLIVCVQNGCAKQGWRLMRPDLRSCDVMDRPPSAE